MGCEPSVHGERVESGSEMMYPAGLFATAIGNPANAGFLLMNGVIELRIQASMNQKNTGTTELTERLVESLGSVEEEPLTSKVLDSLHRHIETLSPGAFLKGAREFLDAVGMNGLTQACIDEVPLQRGDAPGATDLQQAIGLCDDRLSKDELPVHRIEISSYGRNERFQLWLNFGYTRRHRHDEASVILEVREMSSRVGPKQGESFADYKMRMKTLDSELEESARTYRMVEEDKKALFSDFSYHLSEAFPGVRLLLFEGTLPGQGAS